MEKLEVRLFGGLRLNSGGIDLPPLPSRNAEALFSFLVLHRNQCVHREIICSHLWGDKPEAEARKALRTALWRIRCVIEPDDPDRGTFIRVEPHRVGFRPSHGKQVDVDVWQLADAADIRSTGGSGNRLSSNEVAQLQAAARVYTGALMEGEDCGEWTIGQAERYRMVHLAVLERLMNHYLDGGETVEALMTGQEILRHDPLLEHVHRAVMMCHVQIGDRASAVRQYRSCVDVLANELGLPPMEKTVELNDTIVSGAFS